MVDLVFEVWFGIFGLIGLRKIFGQKNFIQKKFWCKRIIWSENFFGLKQNFGPKHNSFSMLNTSKLSVVFSSCSKKNLCGLENCLQVIPALVEGRWTRKGNFGIVNIILSVKISNHIVYKKGSLIYSDKMHLYIFS